MLLLLLFPIIIQLGFQYKQIWHNIIIPQNDRTDYRNPRTSRNSRIRKDVTIFKSTLTPYQLS